MISWRERLAWLRRDGRWIPWTFVAMFLVVLAANGTMVAFSISSWTGVVTESHYLDGLAYNDRLAAQEAQDSLGWQMQLTSEQLTGNRLAVQVDLRDGEGAALWADQVKVRALRPTHSGHDLTAVLLASDAGRYAGEIELPLPGQWDLRITAFQGELSYQRTQRVFLRQ